MREQEIVHQDISIPNRVYLGPIFSATHLVKNPLFVQKLEFDETFFETRPTLITLRESP